MSIPHKVGIAYVPVLHKGYLNYFDTLQKEGVTELYVISDQILEAHRELDYINRKDRIRAVPVETMQNVLAGVLSIPVKLLDTSIITQLQSEHVGIVTPKEDIGLFIVDQYFKDHEVEYSNVFLRRNEENVKEDRVPETANTIQATELQQRIFKKVLKEAEKSTDWWRTIGAALVQNGDVVAITHNENMPEEQLPNIFGDLRALYKKGIHINYVTTAHAEGAVIALAAKEGIKTEGAELYVTDFPCPYCARIIAKSGIKKIYFLNGYYVLDGDELFKAAGIEVVKVII